MQAITRFYALITGLTVFVMFWVISSVGPLLHNGSGIHPLIASAAALAGSVGVYRLLAVGFSWLLARSVIVRSWVFGPLFLHGTWIGYFHGHSDEIRFVVEHYDQSLDGLTITGLSYNKTLKNHGFWTTEATSIRKERLTYTYSFDVISGTGPLQGITSFLFQRAAPHKGPIALSGFAHDLNDAQRIAIQEFKLSDKLLPWADALEVAKNRYGKSILS
jgi:hypothetical protein